MTDWWPVQGPFPNISWDRLWWPRDPKTDIAAHENEWIDVIEYINSHISEISLNFVVSLSNRMKKLLFFLLAWLSCIWLAGPGSSLIGWQCKAADWLIHWESKKWYLSFFARDIDKTTNFLSQLLNFYRCIKSFL